MTNEELFYAYVEEVSRKDSSIKSILTLKLDTLWLENISNANISGVYIAPDDMVELEIYIKRYFLIEILENMSLNLSMGNVIRVYETAISDYNTHKGIGVYSITNDVMVKNCFINIYNNVMAELSRYNISPSSDFDTLDVRGMFNTQEVYYITIGIR